MEYYSALKINEILTHAKTWVKLKDIICYSRKNEAQTNIRET